jgi:enhancing lycopene biosynthesis protein 2
LRRTAPSEFDGVVFTGGFGAAKNLYAFAKDGENRTVRPEVCAVPAVLRWKDTFTIT